MSLSRKSPTNTPQESGIASQNKIADDIAKSKSDAASLKRGRAESVEPSQPLDAVSSTIPKKNRLAPTTGQQPAKPLDPEQSPNIDYDESPTEIAPDTADEAKAAQSVDVASEDKANPRMVSITEEKGETPVGESNNVGEVRRKVAKMSYDELRKGAKNSEAGSAAGQDIEEGDAADSVMSASTELDAPQAGSVAMSNGADGSADHSTSEGLKRKALDRSESSFIKEEEVAQAKRLKDVPLPAGDAKPATESTEATVPPAKKPQASFSAFSSAASPFATARSSSPFASASGSASATNAFGASAGSSSASKPSPFATSGFGNYSKTSSPFAKKPADTPSTAATDEKEAVASEDKSAKAGPSTFGDILKTESKDVESEDAKLQMTEQDVHTGEEDEATAYQTRAKLYVMQADGGWRERGVGTLKLNVRRSDGKGPRLVMRAEGVLRLILNVSLYVGMSCLEDGKHVRLTVFEDGERRFVTLRIGSTKAASELSGHIHEHIPLESSVPPKSPSPKASVSRNGPKEEV